jgi:acetoin utilization protein AcuB
MRMLAKHHVGGFMTRDPFTIGADQPIAVARRIMAAHDVRYLPVLAGGLPVGLLGAGDLARLDASGRPDRDLVSAEDVMTGPLYQVMTDASVVEVARELAARRLGAALVLEDGVLVGIFTTSDALLALARLAEGMPPRRPIPV